MFRAKLRGEECHVASSVHQAPMLAYLENTFDVSLNLGQRSAVMCAFVALA